jgi:hypothetical protein
MAKPANKTTAINTSFFIWLSFISEEVPVLSVRLLFTFGLLKYPPLGLFKSWTNLPLTRAETQTPQQEEEQKSLSGD